MKVTNALVRKALRRAADLVERGFTKQVYRERIYGKYCYCILGAIDQAVLELVGENSDSSPVHHTGGEKVGKWNDRVKTTQQDAVLLLRVAARL